MPKKSRFSLFSSGFSLYCEFFFFLNVIAGKRQEGRKEGVPGNLVDKRLQFIGFIRPGERPAHVAGGVAHIGPDAAGSPLLLVFQRFDNKRHD